MNRSLPLALAVSLLAVPAVAGEVLAPINTRFQSADAAEVPDFQKHVIPLMSRLGCNGRACHGSFQGQGGFRLSLFGYDFNMDHENITSADAGRIDADKPEVSLVLEKPTLETPHEGGKRMEQGSWQHHVLLSWVKGGAKNIDADHPTFVRLDVTPAEILFQNKGEQVALKAVAVWSDGSQEDVTPLCRFQTNSGQVAEVGEEGLVTAVDPGDTHIVVFYDGGVVPIPVMRPVSDKVGPKYPKVPTPTKVDELVVEKLRKLGIVPSELASDADFLRRVSIDMTGTLPSPMEVEAFVADSSPDKRAKKIDELLETPAYAAWWTTRLCDITGNNDDQLNNITPDRGAASRDWYSWIHKRVADNVPYDQLVEGIVVANSRNRGESFADYSKAMSDIYRPNSKASFADRESMPHFWARRNYRTPQERVIGFAYTFMGIRIQCAECHKHPFDQWTQDDFKQFTGFFTSTSFGTNPESRDEYNAMLKEAGLEGRNGNDLRRGLPQLLREGKTVPFQELYTVSARRPANDRNRRNNNNNNRNNGARPAPEATLLGSAKIDLTQVDDPRRPLMDWLRDPANPYFARAFVNRVWAGYFNVGIVSPPDDLSLANPPSNRPLLDYLAQGFIASGFDMKWLHREIANSRTYQLSWTPNETNRLDEVNFSRAIPRRMPAEVAYDALTQATASNSEIEKLHADVSGRAISIPGGGRRGVPGNVGYALTIFGRSIRESNCDCDRSAESSLLQTVYLQNDRDVLTMIDRRGGWLTDVVSELGIAGRNADERTADDNARRERTPEKPRNFDQQVEQRRKEIRRLRKNGKDDDAKRLEKRLDEYIAQYTPAGADKSDSAAPKQQQAESVGPMDTDAVVRQAYLRTLSRFPSDDELARSKQYIEQAEDTANGIRGVLWALLNTKEFIVNH